MNDKKLKDKTVIIMARNRGGGSAIALRYAAANVAIISDTLGATEKF
jgi:NAD(P)-dependent dehydrogenase (short-subunit alcohol dehydrogenase family)